MQDRKKDSEKMVQPRANRETSTMSDTVILFGALRSGTTMLRLMLNAHPALSCPGESDFLFDHLRAEDDTWRYDRRKMSLDRIYRASPMELPEDLDGTAALARMIGQARRTPESRPVLVLHRRVNEAMTLLPNAKVIRLVRDPRGVGRSAIGMGWAGNLFHGVSLWITTEAGWADAMARHKPLVHEIRYEDLVTHPEATLTDLCAFLGLAFDPAMLTY